MDGGETLNYYYLGHVVMAWPIKLLGLRARHGLHAVLGPAVRADRPAAYAFAGTLWAAARAALGERAPRGGPVAAGLTAAALVAVLGNLAGVRTWLDAANPPRDYDWFGPSRVIPNTINEFPSFSFILGDLHAHVLALPFTVLALGFALQVALAGPRGDVVWRAVAEALAAGLAVGRAVRGQLVVLSRGGGLAGRRGRRLAGRPAQRGRRGYALVWLGAGDAGQRRVRAAVHAQLRPGGARRRRRARRAARSTKWLGDMALIYGVLAWPLTAAFAAGCSRRATAGGCSAGGSRRSSWPARCWPPSNLTGALVAGRRARRRPSSAALTPELDRPSASCGC